MAAVLKDFAISIIRTLREHGHKAYLVGGCVRDLLLGREPADYDVTTDAIPKEVMRIFPETYAVGAQFGVVLVPQPEKEVASNVSPETPRCRDVTCYVSPKANAVEVATFRSDIGYSDGRHPDQVRFSKDPREDVERRDFTINGLLLDPVTNEVLDFVAGRKDLEAGIIRTIGDPNRRFAEDKLRMLRAVRFAARFDYAIEPATFQATQKLASQIHQVSRERVRDELSKMLTEGRARQAFVLLDQSGLLHEVLPEIEAMKGVEQPPQFHPEGDVFVHTLLLLDKYRILVQSLWPGAHCCMTWASRRRFESLPTASVSTVTSTSESKSPKKCAAVCASPNTTPTRFSLWSTTTCASRTCSR